jgi:Kdo2-lipid IVA lauroyltransferase/acyltransferase
MPSLRTLRFFIEYCALRIVTAVLRILPLDFAVRLAGRLCMVIAPRTRLHQRAVSNIDEALPHLPLEERRRILLRMWENTGRSMAETLMLDRICSDASRLWIVRRAELEQMLQEPGPRIGVTLHLGNWELVGWTCVACGARLAGIYRPLRNPFIDRFVYERRLAHYPGGLLYKGKQPGRTPLGRSAGGAVQLLRDGGHLGFAADQIDNTAPYGVRFFGRDAKFTIAPALFARRLGARLIIGRCLRVGRGSQFQFDYRELTVPRTDHPEADIRQLTAAIAAQFEEWILETPEQWMWWLRRTIGAGPS